MRPSVRGTTGVVVIMLGVLLTLKGATAQTSSWTYSTSTDEVTGKTIRFAGIRSTNTVTFDFPYQGRQQGTLVLRQHPRWGFNVVLNIERGQFLCPPIDNCAVLVRFDDAAPRRWRAVGPEDHSTTSLFIENERTFLNLLRKASTVRIAAKFFQEGERTFIFNVRGLRW